MSWRFGDFTLDEERRQLFRAGNPLALEPKAYELLRLLIAHRPRALSKGQIHGALWPGTFVSESALAGLVTDLRSVLADNARRPRFVRTVHGFGYAFSAEVRDDRAPLADSGEPFLRTLVLSAAGSPRAFDRPQAALTAALGEPQGAAVHVAEFTPGSRPPLLLRQLAGLAQRAQVLLSRTAFDLARDGDQSDDSLVWLAHGPYLFEGISGPVDVFEVGRHGQSFLKAPPDTKAARRAVRPGDEVTLGWRPAPGLSVPGREGWTFVDKLGEGGFGEVWLAAYASGERRVFKFCFDASRLRALKREATLFRILKEELGDRDDIARVLDWNFEEPPFFLESEYTEAGNFADWGLAAGGIANVPLETRLLLVAQVAEALAAAHSVGVLHKDVKPQNVLISEGEDGKPRAQLTDFGVGLVKDRSILLGRDFTVAGFTELTEEGNRIGSGTRLYAAPEVLEGKTSTTLADIYSLGVLLYQVVVGDFERALAPGWERDVSDDLLRDDISICVQGRPERRLGNALQLAERLRTLKQRRAEKQAPRLKYREVLAWTLLIVTAGAALALAVVHFRQTLAEPKSYRFSLIAPDNSTFAGPVSVSPDGHLVAMIVSSAGGSMLSIRRLDSPTAQALPGTEGADGPFWSPDSRSIGFFAVGKLKKVDSAGGPAQTVCDAPNGSTGTWSRDGVIVFARDTWDSALYRVPADGGTPSVTIEPNRPQEVGYSSPQFLPDGRHFLFHMHSGEPIRGGVYLGSLDSKQTKWIMNTPWTATYAPSGAAGREGHLLFVRDGTLMAQRFDTNRLELAGQPVAVIDRLLTDTHSRAFVATSENGVLVYSSKRVQAFPLRLVWVDRQGRSRPLSAPSGYYEAPRISPDGQRVAVQIDNGLTSDVWIYDLSRADFSRLTYDGMNNNSSIVWAPDSKRVVFSSSRHGPANMYIQDADGRSPAERILPGPNLAVPNSWSRDGRTLIFVYLAPISNDPAGIPITGENGEVWAMPLQGRKPQPLLRGPFRRWQGMLSPDGRWLAYVSDESGQFEVYVTAFPSLQGRWQISTEGGGEVRWAPNGRELFWRQYDRLMAATVDAQAGFSVSKPHLLFTEYMSGPPGIPAYDVAPDGQRFLMLKQAEGVPEKTQINVVVNWSTGLTSGSGIGTNK